MAADQVGILTDSVACLPPDRVDELGIEIVRVHLLVGTDDLLDGDIGEKELHGRVAAGESASTATPSPGEFAAAFRSLADRGASTVLALTVSGALSNLANAARVAARHASLPVRVIDTRTAASAQGLIARRLAEQAKRGASLEDLEEAFPAVRGRTGLVAMVPDLGRLARTGRVPRIAGFVGGRLDIKPLIRIGDDGEAHVGGVTRAMESGMRRMVHRAEEVAGPDGRLVVMHTLAEPSAEAMAGTLRERLPSAEVEVAPFTTVMGIHTGPGLLGVAWEAP